PPHEEARAWLLGELKAAGLTTWVDPAGNVFGALGADRIGAAAPVVLTGSHIDTVPEGGILDGALGVMAGLECLHVIREAGARVVFHGQADHAGTTPMERRRDAFLAAADYALRARELVVSRGGARAVTNIGVVQVHPGASNIVPGRAELVHEMRDPDAAILERLARECDALAREVAAARGITVEVRPMSATTPAPCAPRVQETIEAVCASLGLASRRLYSAAGHDA